ncbi:MAG: hypothetical protein H0X42_10420 [Solirubrobacterales bacterium]|nr:hypothetical protein [Solirubrobacterales bacterium]
MATSPTEACVLVLLFTGVVAPLVGLLLWHVGGSWDSIGKGPFAIEGQQPRPAGQPAPAVDPAIRAAEVRQMLRAKSERRQRRGEEPLDIDAEAKRLLEPERRTPSASARMDAELRAEVRQLVVVRNERLTRQGLEPLDVEAETERQLDDLVGSS